MRPRVYVLRRLAMVGLCMGLFFSPAGNVARADALSASEAQVFSNALKEVERGKKKRLEHYARQLNDPLARKIVSWYVLFQGGFGTEFEAINEFIRRNPDWPRSTRLMSRAEEALDTYANADFIIDWFGTREPITELGFEKLAGALLRAGRTKEGIALVRRAWFDGDFSFYKKFRKYLTLADNRLRADRLLWDGKYWPSQRMIYRVDAKYAKLIQARSSLRHMRGNVDYLVSQVPKNLQNDPGLIYERLRWRRKKGLDSALNLFHGLPEGVPYPYRWWDERAIIARDLLQKGHISEAYRIAAQHGLTPEHAADHAEAEWFSGWIALRFLNEPKVALAHFKRMYDGVSFPVSLSRGAYWAGRAAKALKAEKAAKDWYTTAAQHPTTYYGQLAAAIVTPGKALKLPPDTGAGAEMRKRFDSNELVRAVRMLAGAGENDRLYSLITHIATLNNDPSWLALTARLARLSGRPDLAIRVAKQAAQNHKRFVSGGYPELVPPRMPSRINAAKPETSLVLALVRQESEYDSAAISHAGARGLMQLMPATAKVVAKQAGLRYSKQKLITDPDYNLTLGQAYIADLIKDYDGYLPLAIASYNAGPHRVRQWIRENGDPRQPDVDAIDWIELIPFKETRNYVQRVLENVQVYRRKLADTEVALGLERDLGR